MSWGSAALEPGPGGLLVGYLADDEHRPKSAAAMTGCIPYLQPERYVVSAAAADDRGPPEMALAMDAYGNHYVPYQTTTTAFHPLPPHPQMFQFDVQPPAVASSGAGTFSAAAEYVPMAVERDAVPPPPLESAVTSYGGGDPKVTLDPYYGAETVDGRVLVADTSDHPVTHSSYELENGRDVTSVENDALLRTDVDMSVAVETVAEEQGAIEGGNDLSRAITRGDEVGVFEPTMSATEDGADDIGSETTSKERSQTGEEDSSAVDADDVRASRAQRSLAKATEEQ